MLVRLDRICNEIPMVAEQSDFGVDVNRISQFKNNLQQFKKKLKQINDILGYLRTTHLSVSNYRLYLEK